MRNVHFDKFYGSIDHLLNVYDRKSRKYAFNAGNHDEYRSWRESVVTQLWDIAGLANMETCAPELELLESVDLDGIRRDKLLLQTEPDVWMPFYVLLPEGLEAGQKRPSMIAVHGHASVGKYSTAGRTDIPVIKEKIERVSYDYGLQFCKRGYIVFCPDSRGFGERREIHRQGGEVRNAG